MDFPYRTPPPADVRNAGDQANSVGAPASTAARRSMVARAGVARAQAARIALKSNATRPSTATRCAASPQYRTPTQWPALPTSPT